MLVRMRFANFCSFKDEVEFSMVPTREKIHRDQHLFKPFKSSMELLRAGVLYGSNGSGKSNFIRAIEFVERLVIKGRRPNRSMPSYAFKLDKACRKEPSRFYFEIQTAEALYSYEFHISAEAVEYERLAELTKSSEKLAFERRLVGDNTDIIFGAIIERLSKDDQKNIQFVANGTRKNQLFLTETVERNVGVFEPVYLWFAESIRVFSPQSIGHGVEFRLGDDKEFTEFLCDLLSEFDPSIENISTSLISAENARGIPQRVLSDIDDEIDEDGAVFISNVVDGNRSVVMKKDGELHILKINVERKSHDGKDLVIFDLEEESDGTRRLIDLAPLFYELLYSSGPVIAFIDELDRSLHPLATKRLLELFFSKSVARNIKSQVIISTHNTVLLDIDLLRKDEVWIVEKENGASKLLSVQRDFAPRYDRDIRKDYLSGMFGGTPKLNKSAFAE